MKEYLEKQREYINRILLDSLNEVKYPEVMAEGMKYAVLNGGKRLRPLLHFMTLELLGEDIKKGEGMAEAIEMIHSYSLVHDDLPALDNDDYRRGELTTHKKFGEANGILIGDALLTYAFYVLSTKTNGVEAEKIVKLVALTAKYGGVQGMVGGQVVDLEAEKTPADLPTLQYIHTHKTGMMLRLPIEGAAIIAGLEGEKKHALLTYADLIGLAFQIKDDILDVEGTFEEMGKSVGSDQKLGKSTYPSIFGLDKSKEMLNDKIKEAVEIIEKEFGAKAEIFVKLAHYIKDRKK